MVESADLSLVDPRILYFAVHPIDCLVAAVANIVFPAMGHFLNFFEAENIEDLSLRIALTPITLPLKIIAGVAMASLWALSILFMPYVAVQSILDGLDEGALVTHYSFLPDIGWNCINRLLTFLE